MGKIEVFEEAQRGIRELDFRGFSAQSPEMYRQYQLRNTFGLDRDQKIHRIFQKRFLDFDITNSCLTLPKANANIWKDPLENPLSSIQDIDVVTGQPLNLGSLLNSFYALCWTNRHSSRLEYWNNFSHGVEAVRISTTIGKLMDRLMSLQDSSYMYRVWMIDVEYKTPAIIQAMQNPQEVYRRIDSQGAHLALSAAVVRSQFSGEDEVRLLFDASLSTPPGMAIFDNGKLIRVPFDWSGFIEKQTTAP